MEKHLFTSADWIEVARTVQTLRDNGTLAYTQISHKTYYQPEDVMAVVGKVEDKKKDMCYRKRRDNYER